MKIGILDADTVRPHLAAKFGQYSDMFMRLLLAENANLEFIPFDVEQQQYPSDIDVVDAYLVTGSKAGVYQDRPWIGRLAEFIQLLNQRNKKLLAFCFGHQLVAHCLGGRAEKSEKGWGVGVHSCRFTERPAWHQGDEEFRLIVSHQDQVVVPASGARVLAGSDFCPNSVCQIGDHILTFQGHPEFENAYALGLLASRREIIPEDVYQRALKSLEQQTESARVAKWLLAFLQNQDYHSPIFSILAQGS